MQSHLWKLLPSSLTTIQVLGRQLSFSSNFRTYSNLDLAIWERRLVHNLVKCIGLSRSKRAPEVGGPRSRCVPEVGGPRGVYFDSPLWSKVLLAIIVLCVLPGFCPNQCSNKWRKSVLKYSIVYYRCCVIHALRVEWGTIYSRGPRFVTLE